MTKILWHLCRRFPLVWYCSHWYTIYDENLRHSCRRFPLVRHSSH
jgi:hypothetical protein